MLSSLVRKNIIDSGEAIMKGQFYVNPYLKTHEDGMDGQKKTACNFCPYSSICGFEDGKDGNSYRRLYKMELDDIRKKLKKDVEDV